MARSARGMFGEVGGMARGIGASSGRGASKPSKPMTPAQYKKWYEQNQKAVNKATGGKFPKIKTRD